MAACEYCKLEMLTAGDCPDNREQIFPDGTLLASLQFDPEDKEARCHDCNVLPGNYHHPGCDMERCPRCQGQLISCGCLDEDDDL